MLLLRCWPELLLLDRGWPKLLLLLRGWPELLLGSWPELLLLLGSWLEPLLLWLELLLLGLTQLLNGDGLACLVNELGDHLPLGAGNVDRLLTRLAKDGELARLQLDGGSRSHALLLGDGQGGGDEEDEGVPHAGADLTGATRPAVALYTLTPVIVHVGKQCCLENTAKWHIPTKPGILVKSPRIALQKKCNLCLGLSNFFSDRFQGWMVGC